MRVFKILILILLSQNLFAQNSCYLNLILDIKEKKILSADLDKSKYYSSLSSLSINNKIKDSTANSLFKKFKKSKLKFFTLKYAKNKDLIFSTHLGDINDHSKQYLKPGHPALDQTQFAFSVPYKKNNFKLRIKLNDGSKKVFKIKSMLDKEKISYCNKLSKIKCKNYQCISSDHIVSRNNPKVYFNLNDNDKKIRFKNPKIIDNEVCGCFRTRNPGFINDIKLTNIKEDSSGEKYLDMSFKVIGSEFSFQSFSSYTYSSTTEQESKITEKQLIVDSTQDTYKVEITDPSHDMFKIVLYDENNNYHYFGPYSIK